MVFILEISFTIDAEAYVFILWIARDAAAHDWIQNNYTLKEGDEVGSTDEALKVLKSNEPFAPGEVKTYATNTGAGLYVIVLEATGAPASLAEFKGEEGFTTKVKIVDFSKARQDLKHNPEIDIHEGVHRYVSWAKKVYNL